MDNHDYFIRYLYVPLAALAGAITALASSRNSQTNWVDLFFSFVVGFCFAFFVTPWVATEWFGIQEGNVRAIAGLTYVFGAGSNILLPLLIGHLKRIVGKGGGA